MPTREEISEEGFGGFRGTWWIGRVPVRVAETMLGAEAELLRLLDGLASTPDEFEQLAQAVEQLDMSTAPEYLVEAARPTGLPQIIEAAADIPLLDGLEVGVAGLSYVLASIGCLTAASCRSHVDPRSWADCPVVFFAAPPWRVELLAPLVVRARCGLGSDRSLLTLYGRSVAELHTLAGILMRERTQFRVMPDKWRTKSHRRVRDKSQLPLF